MTGSTASGPATPPPPRRGPDTPHLLIGPVLRRVAGTRATVWVETTQPATVRIETGSGAAGSATTFCAYGHHYALVVVEGLPDEGATPYTVRLDDRTVWPPPEYPYPPPVIRTTDHRAGPLSLIFGSCREATPNATSRHLPPDALDAYARRLMAAPLDPDRRPDLIVLLGDQVYADETSAKIRHFLRRRRAQGHPGPADQVVSFEEYTKLYLESWRDPEVRWLLSTVPSAMIFDDHEIIDDWNTSASWRTDMAATPWWAERIAAGLSSYWVYQHLGNLDPDELADDPIYQKVTAAPDATELLHDFGHEVDTGRSYQWSYALDLGRTRLVMLDNRCNRVVTPGRREMLPAAEWDWFLDRAHGDYDHLVVGSSLPWLMPPAIHHLEAWNERTADSPRPRVAARAEKIRRAFDLEHWAAFGRSFEAMGELFRRLGEGTPAGPAAPGAATAAESGAPGSRVGAGPAYRAPATISVLSGDVHHSYVARAEFDTPVTTPVYQLTCSPVHNQVPAFMRPLMRFSWSRAAARALRGVARSAGVREPAWSWKREAGPYFGNAVGTLRLAGRSATVRLEGTTKAGDLFEVATVAMNRDAPGGP